jgi:hypothetical protein
VTNPAELFLINKLDVVTRFLIIALALNLIGCASPCTPRITENRAITLAKAALDADAGKKVSSFYTRYTARMEKCRWIVTGHTPPQSVAGDAHVAVAADTGKTEVWPIMRTDPQKLDKLHPRQR